MVSIILRMALTLTAVSIGLANVPAALADESRTDSIEASTPAGSVSTKVHTAKDSLGNSSTHIESAKSTLADQSSTTIHSETGPAGSSSTASHESVHPNLEGGTTVHRTNESNVVSPAGVTHQESSTKAKTTGDGSSVTVHHEAQTTTP
jgi:hypothetical protein